MSRQVLSGHVPGPHPVPREGVGRGEEPEPQGPGQPHRPSAPWKPVTQLRPAAASEAQASPGQVCTLPQAWSLSPLSCPVHFPSIPFLQTQPEAAFEGTAGPQTPSSPPTDPIACPAVLCVFALTPPPQHQEE